MATSAALSAFFFIFLISPSSAIYRELAPINDFEDGAQLHIFANKLSSALNLVPYDYSSVKHCPASSVHKVMTPQRRFLSLGQLLQGERSHLTGYRLKMGVDEVCKQMCTLSYTVHEQKWITKLVKDSYREYLVLDNMPSVWRRKCGHGFCRSTGVPIGYMDTKNNTCLYNHLRFTVEYHERAGYGNRKRVVFFKLEPFSVDHKKRAGSAHELRTCPVVETSSSPMCFTSERTQPVIWTYEVTYKASQVRWANRWDTFFNAKHGIREIEWYALTNSLMLTLFLSPIGIVIIAIILLRTLYFDLKRINITSDDVVNEEWTGWKALHGDVFRSPERSGLLCVLVGSGAQITCTSAVTLVFALFGLLSPANRGSLVTAMLTVWVLTSGVCGYSAARLYSSLQGTKSRAVTLGSAFFFPGIVFAVFFVLNLVLWLRGSTGAVPFPTLLVLIFMWVGISVPLNVLGSHVGYKQPEYEYPVRTNQAPGTIPASAGRSTCLGMFGGILPFGVVFMTLLFILASIYEGKFFYFFDFLAVLFLVLVATCAGVSIILTYSHLAKEYYHWWWPSFLTTASSGAYVFVYCLFFAFKQNSGGNRIVSTLVSVGYSAIFSLAFALAAGCIGFFTSFVFVRIIFAVLASYKKQGTLSAF